MHDRDSDGKVEASSCGADNTTTYSVEGDHATGDNIADICNIAIILNLNSVHINIGNEHSSHSDGEIGALHLTGLGSIFHRTDHFNLCGSVDDRGDSHGYCLMKYHRGVFHSDGCYLSTPPGCGRHIKYTPKVPDADLVMY